jgi:hypothetical protein
MNVATAAITTVCVAAPEAGAIAEIWIVQTFCCSGGRFEVLRVCRGAGGADGSDSLEAGKCRGVDDDKTGGSEQAYGRNGLPTHCPTNAARLPVPGFQVRT